MTEHEASGPPSPPPSAGDTGRHAAFPSGPHFVAMPETTEERALRIALETRKRLGQPPDASGFEGTGLWKYVARMNASVDTVVDWTKAHDLINERRASVGARVAWEVARTVIPVVVLAFLAWAGGFLHR